MFSFDYTAFVVIEKVGIPLSGLIEPVGRLKLTILSLSAIDLLSKVLEAFYVITLLFEFLVSVRAFCIGLSQILSRMIYLTGPTNTPSKPSKTKQLLTD